MNNISDSLQFPKDRNEAEKRFRQYKSLDPLPEIPPALLNSGDIYDYARTTGMVFPFNNDPGGKKLKSASYEIDFLGTVYWMDGENYHEEQINCGDRFTLKKNSIAFIYLEVQFYLPDYLAIRFNLKITHVHRGLLLGTGPLVDPGFCGRLLIPLHNLTSESYVIHGGDGLIWVEFTKLSPHANWNKKARASSANYVAFPQPKMSLSPIEYFAKASGGKPAQSSIPGEVKTASESAKSAQATVKVLSTLSIVGIFGLALGTWQLIRDTHEYVTSQNTAISDMRVTIKELESKIKFLEERPVKSLPKP